MSNEKKVHGNTRHGHSKRGQKTRTYESWCSMFRRCYLPSQRSFKAYGAKGVRVSPEWHEFEQFLEDMGEQPEGKTLDRIDPFGDYSKENCRWATQTEQHRNKRNTCWLELNGRRMSLMDWAEELGIASRTLRARIDDYGWTVEQALTTPVMSRKQAAQRSHDIRYGRAESPWAVNAGFVK